MFTTITTSNPIEQAVYDSYSEGKGRLFQIFFGWRHTDKNNNMTYVIPTKALENLKATIELCKRSL